MSSWNDISEASTNSWNSNDPGIQSPDEYSQQGLSGLTQFLAVLFLIVGMLGITSGLMTLALNALRANGINPLNSPSPPALVPPAPADAATQTPATTDSNSNSNTNSELPDGVTAAPTSQTTPNRAPNNAPITKPGPNQPPFKFPEPTSTELIVSSVSSLFGLAISIGMLVSSIQTLRRRRSGSIWLSNFCLLSMLLVLTWGLQSYYFYESFKEPFEALAAAQDNLPPEVPPERVAEFQERMEYITPIGLMVGFGCAGLFFLLHFVLYLIGATHFRSARVLERMQH